jgi:Holliday junction resolvase
VRRGKIDNSQPAIVAALRKIGATVQILAAVGHGCPDLLVGFRGRTLLIECKSTDTDFGRNRVLTEDEETWHCRWTGGELYTVQTPMEAIRACVEGPWK